MTDTGRLLREAQGGNRGSLDALYARHRGRLLGFVRSRMSPGLLGTVSPEDVLQETLLESARKLDSFEDRGPASFYRWLVEIARFKILEADRARKTRKRSAVEPMEAEPTSRDTSPSGRAVKRERADLLRDALASLPGEQGEALRLRYLEGLTVAETAARLAKSDAAVKALVSRGLAAMAEEAGKIG